MLFKAQYEKVVDEANGERLFFLGTTRKPLEGGEKFIRVTGVKLTNGNIRTEVVYSFPLYDGIVTKNVFSKELDPVTFERFLNDTAMTIAKAEPGNKLVELPLAYLSMPDINMLNEEQAYLLDLLFLATSGYHEQTRTGYVVVKDIVEELNEGKRKPSEIKNTIIATIQEVAS
jgi:hypothetical protein